MIYGGKIMRGIVHCISYTCVSRDNPASGVLNFGNSQHWICMTSGTERDN